MRPVLRLPALLPLAALVLGCHIEEPFARDNHWDPRSTAVKTLSGPDSTHSIGDRIVTTLVGDPPLPAGTLTIAWISNGVADTATQVFAAGYGEFLVNRAHAGYHPVAVAAAFDDALVSWTVMVGQRIASLDLFCGTAGAPVACDATPIAVNGRRTVSSTMTDANSNAIRRREFAMQRATVVVRDPSVFNTAPTLVNPQAAWTVNGLAPGSSWLVITIDGVRDSVRIVVN